MLLLSAYNRGDDRVIRASRHYERAGQILTRLSVATARKFISGTPCDLPPIGKPITVTAPIRVDLSGAWSDTPPQAYEWGGAVVTVAMTINDEVSGPYKSLAIFLVDMCTLTPFSNSTPSKSLLREHQSESDSSMMDTK